ncbi:MAG: integrase repeat-containing protein [Patescibacteria group bacterium]
MIELYPEYQVPAFKKLVKHYKKNAVGLLVMATGLGKTIVAASWAKREYKKGCKGLFLCHSKGILHQAQDEFRKVIGNKISTKSFYGDCLIKDWNADEGDIVFATLQSLCGEKNPFFEDEFDYVIVDESHHGQAPTYKEVIEYFTPKKLLGITATPNREDERDIREIFGDEIVDISLEEAVVNGWLSEVRYVPINDNLSHWKLKKIMKEVNVEGKRISIKQLNESIFIKARDEKVAEKIQKYARGGKKVIIFCENILHADNFQKFLPNAGSYHSKKTEQHNSKILQDFRDGNIQYILTVNKMNEGIDVPDAEVIVFLRCTDSKTIFYQQLGRGLRKITNKERVDVLDFVSNCNRLEMVNELRQRIDYEKKGKSYEGISKELSREVFHVSGEGYDFFFDEEQINILNSIQRINATIIYYPTWQEASAVVARLKLKSRSEYFKVYKRLDHRLPSHPWIIYDDFPGWTIFLGREKKDFYKTWQEAGVVVAKSGIKTLNEYCQRYKEVDPRLPSNPRATYNDFPGWSVFIGEDRKMFFETWQEASAVAIDAGISTIKEYMARYKKVSPRLPCWPNKMYGNFPGWDIFLNKVKYPNWKKASAAAINLNIKTVLEYSRLYKKDLSLPSAPYVWYKDFPGWDIFLERSVKSFYETWQEASEIAISAELKTKSQYRKMCKKADIKLPVQPEKVYGNFPGWDKFLGRIRFYSTWQEAGRAAIQLGVTSGKSYKNKRETDPKLPFAPDVHYKDFPGWEIFLGKKVRCFYRTWQEASKAIQEFAPKVISSTFYRKRYKEDWGLPSQPQQTYKDFPGWKKFLGKEK